MKQVKFRLLFCCLLSLTSLVKADSAQETARLIFSEAAASPSVPGISVAVADSKGVVWAAAFGYADLENKVAMSIETKMRIGSVAKVITAAALMKLYEQGKVNLDADIRELVPEWPDKHNKITLRHLTNHTSGIRHYQGNEFYSNIEYKNSIEALNIFKNSPLRFLPGSQISYSTYAWTLVSGVMERATNEKDFKTIIRQQVLSPLNLNDTTFDDSSSLVTNRQRPYSYVNNQLVNSKIVNMSYKYAGGGFLSTPSDVVSFATAHLKPGFLKAETLNLMFKKTMLESGRVNHYGVGWEIGFESRIQQALTNLEKNKEIIGIMKEHPNSVMHSGGSLGGVTMMILCLEHQHSVAVVKNVDGERTANTFELAVKALDIFYSQ